MDFIKKRPCPAEGSFVKCDETIYIVAHTEKVDAYYEFSWLIDAEGNTRLWSDGERSDGTYLSNWTPAKPGKLKGDLGVAAKRWKKRETEQRKHLGIS